MKSTRASNAIHTAPKQRPVGVLLLAVVSICLIAHATAQTTTDQTFLSSGKTIHIERFAPADTGRHPAVLVLYGAAGMTQRGDAFREYARDLAQHGYVAFILHYFDATDSPTAGTLPVSPEQFKRWSDALRDGISSVSRDPGVDGRRVGVVGFSLGAFLALWEASQDTRVKAVSEYYGGTSLFLGPPKRMPATLILHGEKDSFVPVEEARKLQRLVEQEHAPCEIKIYQGLEHGFDADNPAARQDAWDRTLRFFRKYLAR